MNIYKRYLDPHIPASEVYGLLIKNDRPTHLIKPHTHNYCEFTLYIKGDVVHIVNDTTQQIKPCTLCFVRSSDIHFNKNINSTPAEYYNVGIPNDILNRILNYFNVDSSFLYEANEPFAIALNQSQYKSLLYKCDEFINSDFGVEHGYLFEILLAEVIYIVLTCHKTQNKISTMPEWFSTLILKIEEKRDFTITVTDLYDMCNYSYNHIIRCFKKYLSCTPTEYLNQLKLDNAAKMLLQNNCTILDCCMSSGFNSETHFYKLFKKHYSMTPKEYIMLNKT